MITVPHLVITVPRLMICIAVLDIAR